MNERKITRWREEVKSVKGADKASRVKVSRKFPFANIFGRQTLENNLESNFHSRFSIALTNPNVLTKSSSQKEKKKKKTGSILVSKPIRRKSPRRFSRSKTFSRACFLFLAAEITPPLRLFKLDSKNLMPLCINETKMMV